MNYGIGNVKAKIGGGDAELNIAYGLTPPSDTSKIWVRTDKTPVKESFNYYLPLTKNPTSLEREILVNNSNDLNLGYSVGLFCYKSYIYMVGGYDGTTVKNTIYRFNMETKQLELLDVVFPINITFVVPIVVKDKAYFVGGMTTQGSGTTATNSIYEMDLKTHQITLKASNSGYIPSEAYNIFNYNDKTIIWSVTGGYQVCSYNIETNTINFLGTSATSTNYAYGKQNKYGYFSLFGYNDYYSSVNALSLSSPMQKCRGSYGLSSNRWMIGCFLIGKKGYSIGGNKDNGFIKYCEQTDLETLLTIELLNIEVVNGSQCWGANFNESMGVIYQNKYLYIFRDKFALNENEVIIEIDKNNDCENVYIGDNNNKAQLLYCYKYNAISEKWEGINCADYTIE